MYNDIDNYLWRSLFMSKNCAKAKPKIMSHITFNKLFFNNDDMCRNFFLNVFHPLGLVCPECGCVHFTLLKCRNNVYTCSQCSHQVYLFYRNYLSGQQITIIYTSLWYISFYHFYKGYFRRRTVTSTGHQQKKCSVAMPKTALFDVFR